VRVLVTGGAGYVGSHTVKRLLAKGATVVVLDTLERGYAEFVRGAELIVGNVADATLVEEILARHPFDAVMHFAAYASVEESVREPERYRRNNVDASRVFLDALVRARVKQIVFSSSCSTYGIPDELPIPETHPQRPINPYGETKVAVEKMLADLARTHGMRSVIFRYFNAAGADPDGDLGEWHEHETRLIPLALDAALGRRDAISINGIDYPTPDGTCIRDFVHVSDIADAHVLGLESLAAGAGGDVFNLGNGAGFSVRQVLSTAERVTGRPIAQRTAQRRPGDPPALVGSSAKARRVLGWVPRLGDLDTIIQTAWRWHRQRTARAS
jgi:UDP-glucose 4-epimerase